MRGATALLITATALTLPQLLWAQSGVTTGMLLGTTVDQDGSALPGVTVAATNADTGLQRHAVAGADGSYRIEMLPPDTYDVSASLTGFRTEVQQGVPVTLGSRVIIDVIMTRSAVSDEIVVTAEVPVVELTNPDATASVSDTAIASLPLYGRDFNQFVLLTPAAVAGRSASSSSATEVNGGKDGFNIGARAVQNSFNVDGSNSNSSFWGNQRGGVDAPFTFSQAAIKELQVVRSSYNLQFSASGGVVNAITKSGTNQLHGEVFGYWADDSMIEANALGEEATDFDQKQFGVALGGPLVRNRLHYFVAYDGQEFDQPSFREFQDFPEDRAAEWEALTDLDWQAETGTVMKTRDANALLAKLNWQAAPAHLLVLRHNWMDFDGDNQYLGWRNYGRSADGVIGSSYNSLVASLSSVLADHAFNELILQYALEERPRTPNTSSIPGVRIRSDLATFGQNTTLPNSIDEERLQLIDNLTWDLGVHSLKAGLNIDLVEFDNRFLQYNGGYYEYFSWQDFLDGAVPFRYSQAFSDSGGRVVHSNNTYAAYLQDEWRIGPDLTLFYGVRYDYQDHDQPRQANPLVPLTGQIPNDSDNWAPLVAFAWDLGGRGTQVLRGGFRYHYDSTSTVLASNAMLDNGIQTVTVRQFCDGSGGCPTFPHTWGSVGDLQGFRPQVSVFDPEFENPETRRLSLGYERIVLKDLAIGIDAIYSETRHLHHNQDQNLRPTGEHTVDGRPVYQLGAVYPELGAVVMFRSNARGHSKALVLSARKRYADGWFLDASYTWSRSRDQNSNERAVSLSSAPEDQYDLGADWGPSNHDVEHKLVISGGSRLPWGLMVSGMVFIRSGFPYSALHFDDLNGDGWWVNERAVVEVEPGVYAHYPRNSERQPWYRTVNLRLSKTFNLPGAWEAALIGEVFNLLDADNWWTSKTTLSSGCYYDQNDQWVPCTTRDDFGEPNIPGDPRSYQLGLKLRF